MKQTRRRFLQTISLIAATSVIQQKTVLAKQELSAEEFINQRIRQETGLTDQRDIDAYCHFVHHADKDTGLIMYGDVQHDFHQELIRKSSEQMKALERIYNESLGNHIHENPKGESFSISDYDKRQLASPISRVAKKLYAEYYHKFMQMGLIEPPRKGDLSGQLYPFLKGYDYFNDPQIYVKCRTKGEKRWTGRTHIDTFKEYKKNGNPGNYEYSY